MSIDGWGGNLPSTVPQVSWTPLPLVRHALSGATMGTRYSAVFNAPLGIDMAPVAAALSDAVGAVDAQMSNWTPTSDISRVNAADAGAWVTVARNTIEVIETGLAISRLSGGAFDLGIGAAVDAWGFGPARAAPDRAAIAHSAGGVDTTRTLDVDRVNARLRKLGPLQLDLCGIAKGFGVDELARTLDGFGVHDYLVSIDGELRGKGRRVDGSPWQVAVERPSRDERAVAAAIGLTNRAIATSGDYRHQHVHDGVTVSHTIDPRTGRPLDNGLASVSVMAANCMAADAWATALLVAGPAAGPDLAQANGLDALFILRRQDELLELPIGAFA